MSKNIVNAKLIQRANDILDKNVDYVSLIKEFNVNFKRKTKILFVNLYSSNKRNFEFNEVLEKNLQCPEIDKVVVIISQSDMTNEFIKADKHQKLDFIFKGNRPTYGDVFKLINSNIEEDEIAIFANSDIYFDESLKFLDYEDMKDKCFALTRYDIINKEGEYKFHSRIDSQDCWIFQGRIKNGDYDFYFGKPGCDNRIAYELEKAGYDVSNPCFSIKSYHLHLVDERKYDTKHRSDTIPQPYKFLEYCYTENHLIVELLSKKIEPNEKRILHIGLTPEKQIKFSEAMKNISDEYLYIDWRRIFLEAESNVKLLQNYLLEKILYFHPNLIFFQIQSSGIINYEFIELINKVCECKIINWTGDVREPIPKWYLDVGKVDNVITCFTNEDDVNKLKKKKIKSEYLQIGYEHNIFNRNGSIDENCPDIVFFGNNYGNKFPLGSFRLEVIDVLKSKYGKRFQVYGSGYPQSYGTIDLNIKSIKEAQIYRSCKIAIGISHFQLKKYSSDRLYRAMGSGAFYMPHWYPDIDKDFINHVHLVWWKDINELISNIDFYLNNEHERKEIANCGNALIEENHRWKNRMDDLKEILGW